MTTQGAEVTQRTATEDLFRLDGQVAIVTGASGLLGEQHALALADAGADVVLSDVRPGRCEELASRLRSQPGHRALAVAADVTSAEAWREVLAKAMDAFGRVDILVNNAAYTNQSPTPAYSAGPADFPLEDWRQILDVNLTGVFLGCQTIGKQMLQQKSGSIINLASLYGVVSPNHRIYPGTGLHQPIAYSVSKGAVINLTRYLAAAWADAGVRVNCITPGGIQNGQPQLFRDRFAALNPMGRMQQPDEIRGALVYLASAASRACTGHNLVVDGGWTIW
jgi:NAD(P)-dependent dehydrogenase (short-subunit alcohol dehydrogenase family)